MHLLYNIIIINQELLLMSILWAFAGPGTVLGVGGAVVLGLNSHAAPTKETRVHNNIM